MSQWNTNPVTVSITVDGETATAVSTYAASAEASGVVWQKSLSVGTHTLKLTDAGTSGRPRIDVDAVMRTTGPTNEATPAAPVGPEALRP